MKPCKINLIAVIVGTLMGLMAMAGNGYAQPGCKQVCVQETTKCVKQGNSCVQYGNTCAQYRNNCVAYNRYGACTRHQQVCAQYRQTCTRYQQGCLQQQKVCSQYQNVCPSQPTPRTGKAFEQLKEIGGGKDSTFDGGPGSTLNRR